MGFLWFGISWALFEGKLIEVPQMPLADPGVYNGARQPSTRPRHIKVIIICTTDVTWLSRKGHIKRACGNLMLVSQTVHVNNWLIPLKWFVSGSSCSVHWFITLDQVWRNLRCCPTFKEIDKLSLTIPTPVTTSVCPTGWPYSAKVLVSAQWIQ